MDRVTEGWVVKVNILCIYILGTYVHKINNFGWKDGWAQVGKKEGREGKGVRGGGNGSEGGRMGRILMDM